MASRLEVLSLTGRSDEVKEGLRALKERPDALDVPSTLTAAHNSQCEYYLRLVEGDFSAAVDGVKPGYDYLAKTEDRSRLSTFVEYLAFAHAVAGNDSDAERLIARSRRESFRSPRGCALPSRGLKPAGHDYGVVPPLSTTRFKRRELEPLAEDETAGNVEIDS